MTRGHDHATATDPSTDRSTCARRPLLTLAGLGVTLPFVGGVATAEADTPQPADGGGTDEARPPIVHPTFGYSGTRRDDVPERLEPDETVGLHVEEELIDGPAPGDFSVTVEFGAFHFDPVGLHVEAGSIVAFVAETPEHTVTAYHPGQARQQRVPNGAPAFSSAVTEQSGFWLYRFEEPGVYDLFCAPHEWAGMGMRIVVGDDLGPAVREPALPGEGGGRPPLPMAGALLGSGLPPNDPDLGHPSLAPANIVDAGAVRVDELDLDLAVTLSGPHPT